MDDNTNRSNKSNNTCETNSEKITFSYFFEAIMIYVLKSSVLFIGTAFLIYPKSTESFGNIIFAILSVLMVALLHYISELLLSVITVWFFIIQFSDHSFQIISLVNLLIVFCYLIFCRIHYRENLKNKFLNLFTLLLSTTFTLALVSIFSLSNNAYHKYNIINNELTDTQSHYSYVQESLTTQYNEELYSEITVDSNSSNISVIDITNSVDPGEVAHISIRGKPFTEYFITVKYNSGISRADGLESKSSDENGYVNWTWKVGTKTFPGTYPVTVYNSNDKLTTYFKVNY